MQPPVREQEKISLELLIARDITPLLSSSTTVRSDIKTRESLAAFSSETDVLLSSDSLPKDLPLVGILGMTIDQNTGHIWWSHNHGNGSIRVMDASFQHGQSYMHDVRGSVSSISKNFRDIVFVGEMPEYSAIILDACGGPEYRSTGTLHYFDMPGFHYKGTISLDARPEYIVPYKGMLLLCEPDSLSPNSVSVRGVSGRGTKVTVYDPEKKREVRRFFLERTGSLFCVDEKIKAIQQESFDFYDRNKTRYSLVTLADDGTVEDKTPLATTNFNSGVAYLNQRLRRHPSGLLFFSGYGPIPDNASMHPTLEVFAPNGERITARHIPFSMGPSCFDAQGNLVALATVQDSEKTTHLLGVKYAVHYDPAILPQETTETQRTMPQTLRQR